MSGRASCPCTAHPSPRISSATWKTLSWLPMLTEHTRKASLHLHTASLHVLSCHVSAVIRCVVPSSFLPLKQNVEAESRRGVTGTVIWTKTIVVESLAHK